MQIPHSQTGGATVSSEWRRSADGDVTSQSWIWLAGNLLLVLGCCSAAGCEADAQVDFVASNARANTPASSESGPGWPNWMGPKHDGVSADATWSTEWPADGLPEAWRKEIGIGFSSVAIRNGRLITMGHRKGDDESESVDIVYCLNVRDGKTIWTHEYAAKIGANLYEGGPGATPTIDGDHVYTLGKQGQFFCLALVDGTVVWETNLASDLGVPVPEWGFNSSAYVAGDDLLLEAGRVVSYDKLTGQKQWQSDKHPAGYGCVRPITVDGQTMLVSLDCESVRLTDPADGSELDAYPWKSPFRTNSTTPIVSGDSFFVSTGYQVGCGLFRIVNRKLELVYDHREMRNHFNNSILLNGHCYGFDGNSNLGRLVQLKCLNFETGEIQWEQSKLGCGSLMIAGKRLVILSEDGRLVIAEATAEAFIELASAPILSGRCWTVPVLLDGRIYARNAAGTLVCVELPK